MTTKKRNLNVKVFGESEKIAWNYHKKFWSQCTRCDLSQTAKKHVLFRGRIPCQFLLVGDAPGEVENVLGVPFTGPIGKELDLWLEQAQEQTGPVSIGVTNLVACIPWKDATEHTGTRLPEPTEYKACLPRIGELLDMCQPEGVIFFGDVQSMTLQPRIHNSFLCNPASVIRQRISNPQLANVTAKKAVLHLIDFINSTVLYT